MWPHLQLINKSSLCHCRICGLAEQPCCCHYCSIFGRSLIFCTKEILAEVRNLITWNSKMTTCKDNFFAGSLRCFMFFRRCHQSNSSQTKCAPVSIFKYNYNSLLGVKPCFKISDFFKYFFHRWRMWRKWNPMLAMFSVWTLSITHLQIYLHKISHL